jgi:molecular chaperone GrpE
MSPSRPDMSEEEKQNDPDATPQDWELDEAGEAIEFPDLQQPAQAEPDGGEPPAGEVDPLTALQIERDEMGDKLKRMAADYQNFARRAEQNIVTARQIQLMDVFKQLVPVLDHFDHAVAVDTETTSAADLLKGVGIVRDELMRTLSSFGVQRLDVEPGEPFDPNRHEALMRQADTDIEPGHVTAQLQPGYVIDDMTIRPAKVSIAE